MVKCNVLGKAENGGGVSEKVKKLATCAMVLRVRLYFCAHRGDTFVVIIYGVVSPYLEPIEGKDENIRNHGYIGTSILPIYRIYQRYIDGYFGKKYL